MSQSKSTRPPAGNTLLDVAGWLLCLALAVVPLAYGGYRTGVITYVAGLFAVIAVVAVAGWACKGRPPRMPVWGWASGAGLAVWLFVALQWADENYLTQSSRELVAWHLERWPASTLWPSPVVVAVLVAGLCGVVLLSADLARRSRWRVRFLGALAIGGAAAGLVGLAQVTTGAESVYWMREYGDQRDVLPGHFFGPFFHHSVAGAFLNLAWPAAAGLAVALGVVHGKPLPGAALFWAACAMVGIVAVLANVSKAAVIFAVMIVLAGAIWPGRRVLRRGRFGAWKIAGPVLAVAALAAGLGAWQQSERFALTVERWSEFAGALRDLPGRIEEEGQIPDEAPFDRLVGMEIALDMAADSGWRGFGPGSWIRTFPDYMGEKPLEPLWLWMQFTHQDYLQVLIELGWVGAAAAAVLVFGGYGRGLRSFCRLKEHRFTADGILLYTVLLALTVVLLHALADFPLQIPAVQLAAAVLLGIAWSSSYWRLERKAT